jgi:hypothetical protein
MVFLPNQCITEKNFKYKKSSSSRDNSQKAMNRGVQKTYKWLIIEKIANAKNVPLGETNPKKISTFFVYKIRHRGAQETYTMVCLIENCAS